MVTTRWMAALLLLLGGASAQGPLLVSHGMGGALADGGSSSPQVSATGRYVLFTSFASNLVPGDSNGQRDVFLRDMLTDAIVRVSLASDGSQAQGASIGTDVSADGRFVVFNTEASGLVPGGGPGLYVLDRQSGLLTEETLGPGGASAGIGNETGQIADDGSFLCFASASPGLVRSDTNKQSDIFFRDRLTGLTERVSVSSTGEQADSYSVGSGWGPNLISADGRFVVFNSGATNLVVGPAPPCPENAYLHDRATGETLLLNVTPAGQPANGCAGGATITADGDTVAFHTSATDVLAPDSNGLESSVYLHDTATGSLELAALATWGGQSNKGATEPRLSGDGRFVAFVSAGADLVAQDNGNDRDAYLQDRLTGLTWLASQDANGQQGNGEVDDLDLSRDGRVVAFESEAQLLPGASAFDNIYVYDRLDAPPWKVLEGGVAGALGIPVLLAEGTLLPHTDLVLALANAGAGSVTTLVVGLSVLNAPFKGGLLVPSPDVLVPLPVPPSGLLKLPAQWPNGIPSGFVIVLQCWTPDAAAAHGFNASDGLQGTAP